MNWLTDFVRPKIKKTAPIEIADNLWVKCPDCGQMLFSKELKKSMYVCTRCGHHLRLYVENKLLSKKENDPVLSVMSFSYREGIPREADLVFDVRFLRNPHYVPELRALTGRDARVAAYISQDEDFAEFFRRLKDFLDPLFPRFLKEGKHYLTIAVGCTGGKHRSVYVAERLYEIFVKNS